MNSIARRGISIRVPIILVGVVILASILLLICDIAGAFTRYAPGYSSRGFSSIKRGHSTEHVTQIVGNPLKVFDEVVNEYSYKYGSIRLTFAGDYIVDWQPSAPDGLSEAQMLNFTPATSEKRWGTPELAGEALRYVEVWCFSEYLWGGMGNHFSKSITFDKQRRTVLTVDDDLYLD